MLGLSNPFVYANWDSATDMQTLTVSGAISQIQASFKAIDGTEGSPPDKIALLRFLQFEGVTDDANETTLTVVDPTASNTITLPNHTGTVAVSGADFDLGDYELRAQTLESDVATGTAPITIASTTKVANLNVDQVDDYNTATAKSAAAQIYVSGADGYLPDNVVDYTAQETSIPKNIQVFTSSGTWTRPASIDNVYVKVWGGGGGGGGRDPGVGAGGGGGGGGYSEGLITVTGDVTVTVGAGGALGGDVTSGTDGGTSSFAGSTTIQATGGTGGGSNAAGGAGGVGSVGTINLTGQQGGPGGGVGGDSGYGGASTGGGGGGGFVQSDSVSGTAGTQPGGGGAGAKDISGGESTVGADGMVIVYY